MLGGGPWRVLRQTRPVPGGHHRTERGQGPCKRTIRREGEDMPIRHEGLAPTIDRRQNLRQIRLQAFPPWSRAEVVPKRSGW